MTEYAVDQRRIGGLFGVDENARRLMNYRYAEDICMKTGAGWAPTCPTIKVKWRLPEFAYDDSVHQLELGKRLPELRVLEGADYSQPPTLRGSATFQPPNEDFVAFVREMQSAGDELMRVTGLYRVLKTHLAVNYRYHAAVTDPVCDGPTVRILNHILVDEEEHLRWGQAIYEELADTPARRREALEWEMHLADLLTAAGGVAGDDRPPTA
ncbi:MAG: hypothetical protein GEU80_14565 [Dehalococcoidia bacterium]|nr:hypothetical protein [Dehalococcoidia bacterium]